MGDITELIVIGGLVNKNTAPWQRINWTHRDAFKPQQSKVVPLPRARAHLPAGIRFREARSDGQTS